MFVLMISIFLAGIAMVALEDKIGINKAASALFMSVVLWTVLVISGEGTAAMGDEFVMHLGDVSETLFFVMGSMVIVELIDSHGGFRVITNQIRTTKKRKLLWIVSFLTFILSAVLDNLATGIVMISLLRKLIPHRNERWIYASMIILAANAGGSWSPIGDVTTILLWTKGNLLPAHQIGAIFIPALVSMLVPLILVTRFFKKGADWGSYPIIAENASMPEINNKSRYIIVILGIGTMVMVPVFNELVYAPPFMTVMFGVSILWAFTDLMYGRMEDVNEEEKMRLGDVLSRIDMPTILFFLGILMSVAALDTSGQLTTVSNFLSAQISSPLVISFVIGVMSSFVDNVALVAATMGMYPVDPASVFYAVNGEFWTFLAYCAVTGGSLLIIGSATGVTVMGMEKIPFVYYLKRFSLVALAGYVAGALTYILIS